MIQTSDVIVFVGVFIALAIMILNRRGLDKLSPKIDGLEQGISKLESKNQEIVNTIIDERKRKFTEMPSVILHYINKAKFRQFYSREFQKELFLESVSDETTNAVQGNINGNVRGVVQAGLEQAKTIKQISNFRVGNEEVLLNLFLEYQKITVVKDKVTLGIDEVEIPDIQTISDNMRQDKKNIGDQLTEKIIGQTIRKIEQTKRLIIIEGFFDKKVVGDDYKYTYSHPINDYISLPKEHITFSFSIPINAIEDEVKNLHEKNLIQMTIFGYVMQYINSEKGIFDLEIIPIAVY